MRLRAEWRTYIHAIRAREVQIVFSACPTKLFEAGLEIGAGDGFQAQLLTRYVANLISTDYYPGILENPSSENLRFMVCDAEAVDQQFGVGRFDLVFSSNVLEHVPNPGRVLRACFRVLTDDGIAVHVVPTPFWKLCQLLLHIPDVGFTILDRLATKDGLSRIVRAISGTATRSFQQLRGSNPKTPRPARPWWQRAILPEPHGVSETNWAEFEAFGRARWEREFTRAGFDIVSVRKGPAASGYGFGLEWLRKLLESCGLTSEWAFVLAKRGAVPRLWGHFRGVSWRVTANWSGAERSA